MKFFEGIRPSMYFQGARLKQDKKTSVRYWMLTMAITMKSSEVYQCEETIVSNYEQISCEENCCEELSIAHVSTGFSIEFFELADSLDAALCLGGCEISNLRLTRVDGLVELWINIEHENNDSLHKFVKDYAFTRVWARFAPRQGKLAVAGPPDALASAIDEMAAPVREGRMESISITAGGKTVKIDKAAAENIHRNATKGK